LVEGLTADLEDRVVHSDLDGAIRATVPQDSHLNDSVLYHESFWIALPGQHHLANRDAVDVADLADEELLLLADGHCLRDQVLDACSSVTGSHNANTRDTSMETLLALVAAGDGVTLVPALARASGGRTTSTFVTRPEASRTAGRMVRLVCCASFPRADLVRRLTNIICASVPKEIVKVSN
jgi:LysR family hydrogen peroxide-inducible transcriptional activator